MMLLVLFGGGLLMNRAALGTAGNVRLPRRAVPRRRPHRPAGRQQSRPVSLKASTTAPIPTVTITLGHRHNETIQVDLAAARGMRFVGPTAHRAARSLLRSALSVTDNKATVLTTEDVLTALLGDEAEHVLDHPRLRVEATSDQVLEYLSAEVSRRMSHAGSCSRRRDERSADDGLNPVICFLDPAGDVARFRTELNVGGAYGIGAVMIGDWPFGTTLCVDQSGTVVDATGATTSEMIGVQMALTELADAPDRRGCAPKATFRARQPGTDDAPSPSMPAQSTEGTIRLLGSYAVEGPARHIRSSTARDLWALLGLLAEHHAAPLSWQAIHERLWPDLEPSSDRFWRVMKEARVKLRQALGRPSDHGKIVIQKVGNGFRINPDLFTVDLWQLRDELRTAATVAEENRVEALAAAVRLYTGPLLPGCDREWAEDAARALDHDIIEALVRLSSIDLDSERAATYLERATTIDPTGEHLYRRRMQLYADLGRIHSVHLCYDQCSRQLAKIDHKPERKTTELFHRLTSET